MSSHTAARAAIVEPLRRVLRWLASLRDREGRIVCPEHQIEHTGKSAGAIVLAAELLLHDPDADARLDLGLAVEQARRLCANLVREGQSACHTFRPGLHDPFNGSNNVIDGGACAAALAHLVTRHGPRLEAADRERFSAAALLHARTYLRYAVLDKGVPAQRAWGLTGLAGAWSLEHDATLESAALEAVGVLEGIQHRDGSYPYHPLEWGGPHAGAADVSSFYQSRVTAFLLHALERLGRDPTGAVFRAPLVRGLDFLEALQGPDGVKCGLVEAKPWYFGAEYEVASHPFDVFALARGWSAFRRASYGRAAARAFRAWVEHLGPDGRPSSHHAAAGRSRSYQCPLFWAAHAEWIARALPELEACASTSVENEPARGAIDLSVAWFPDAGLARLEDAAVVAWIRGARPAGNVHHGSPRGAGLLRAWSRARKQDLVDRVDRWNGPEAEWRGAHGSWSPARGWRDNRDELRFSVWLARVAWRAGRPREALATPWRVAWRALVDYPSPRVSSACDLAPVVEVRGDGVILRSALAHADGRRVPGSALERAFTLDGSGLVVEDRLVSAGEARAVEYVCPRAALEREVGAARAAYRLA